jgi:rsbT antagonist protein RsbS
VTTKATLADAFMVALKKTGSRVTVQHGAVIHGTHPYPAHGALLLVTIQVDMHDRLAMTLQDDLTERIVKRPRARRTDRHLRAGRGGFLHRPHDQQHRLHGARARRPHRGGGHAAGRGHHPGRAGLTLDVRTALNVERGVKLLESERLMAAPAMPCEVHGG